MRCESCSRYSISASSRSPKTERTPAAFRRLAGAVSALLVSATPLFSSAQQPLLEHAPRVASYTLQAKLDAAEHRISGRGTIELHNYTQQPLSELYLHLYMNAFKNDESLFL